MRAISREIKAREAELDSLEFDVMCFMKDATELLLPDTRKTAVTWADRASTWLDQTALKEAHPKIHKDFVRKTSSRVFLLKSFAWKE